VESQTEIVYGGRDKPDSPDVTNESTHSDNDESLLTQLPHPFNSCTAANCLVCATIGKNLYFIMQTSLVALVPFNHTINRKFLKWPK